MSQLIIDPAGFPLPKVSNNVILFPNLEHLTEYHNLTGGGEIKSFGPAKRFNFQFNGVPITAIGGLIGAPVAAMTAENAFYAGGRNFISFGCAGWIGRYKRQIGDIVLPRKALDTTSMTQEYGGETTTSDFLPLPGFSACEKVVTVNSVYRLTKFKIDSYHARSVDLIDMESAVVNYLLQSLGASYRAIFVISDRVENNYRWYNGLTSPGLTFGIKRGLSVLASALLSCRDQR